MLSMAVLSMELGLIPGEHLHREVAPRALTGWRKDIAQLKLHDSQLILPDVGAALVMLDHHTGWPLIQATGPFYSPAD